MIETITVRPYAPQDLPEMIALWNEVVEEGIAFPQEEPLTLESGAAFFAGQSHSAVAADISATPAMPSAPSAGGCTSGKHWLRTVWSRDGP